MATPFHNPSARHSDRVSTWAEFGVEDEVLLAPAPQYAWNDIRLAEQASSDWSVKSEFELNSRRQDRYVIVTKSFWASPANDDTEPDLLIFDKDGGTQYIEVKAYVRNMSGRAEPVGERQYVLGEKSWRNDPHYDALETRVSRLAELTAVSGDPFNRQSADRLLTFCHGLAAEQKPSIFPMLNGDLRAVWENDTKEQVAIRFRSDGRKQYVMFRIDEGRLIETMGTELTVAGIEARVRDLGLRKLWFHGAG